jgi:hypothetical protein
MQLFSNLMGDDPLPARSILDDEDILLGDLRHMINIPIRVKKQQDEYSKSLRFLKRTTLVSINGDDILNFTNQTGLIFRSVKDYTKEFGIKGFESKSICFNKVLYNESFSDKIGVLYTNQFKARVNGELSNVCIVIKDMGGCGIPCININDSNKGDSLSLTNFDIRGCFAKLNIKTHNRIHFNNFTSGNINEVSIVCNDKKMKFGLTKQISSLFDFSHKFRAWNNNDIVVELQLKSLKDIIDYYENNLYNTLTGELPFKLNDISLRDIINVDNIYNLENIIIKFNQSKLILTKDINIAKKHWMYRYTSIPQTLDGWYVVFSCSNKTNRRSY